MNLQDSSTPLHIHSRHMLFFSIICFYLYKRKYTSYQRQPPPHTSAEAPPASPGSYSVLSPAHFKLEEVFRKKSPVVAHMQPPYIQSHQHTVTNLWTDEQCVYTQAPKCSAVQSWTEGELNSEALNIKQTPDECWFVKVGNKWTRPRYFYSSDQKTNQHRTVQQTSNRLVGWCGR